MGLKTKACLHGTFTFYDNDIFIGGSLDKRGDYSEDEVQFLLSLIDETSTVVEVGANIGAITVPLGKRAKRVIAYEPQSVICDLLRENVTVNDLWDIIAPCQVALGANQGKMGWQLPLNYDGRVNTGQASLEGGHDDVAVDTLDHQLLDRFPRIDLVKIDVEGMESEVVAGGLGLIERDHPIFYVENDREEKSAALIKQLFDLGYALYWHFPALFNPNEFSQTEMVSINMLCLPPGSSVVVDLTKLTPVRTPQDNWVVAHEQQRARRRRVAEVEKPKTTKQWAAVVRMGGVGDNLLASAPLKYLKEKYGNVEVITADPHHVIFENNPYVDKLAVKRKGDPPWGNDGGKSWNAYWDDRAREYAGFFHLSHTMEAFTALQEAQTWFHWPTKARQKLFNRSYLEVVGDVCDVPYHRLEPGFFPTDEERDRARQIKKSVGGKFIGWVISGTRCDKIWPPTNIAIARIIKELNVPVLMFGMPEVHNIEIASAIEKFVKSANGDTDGLHLCCSLSMDRETWPIRRVLTQLIESDIVVSPDTGPAWAVAMRPMPKIILLSHASEENITKHWQNTTSLHADPARVHCWPCHCLHDNQETCELLSGVKDGIGAACISDISVAAVLDAVKHALHETMMEENHVAAD